MLYFFYGFSILFALAGILSYTLNMIELIGIALICYLLSLTYLKNLKIFVISTFVLATLSGGIYLYLYDLDRHRVVLTRIIDFLALYYISVVESTIYINVIHQAVLLLFIGAVVMKALHYFFKEHRLHYMFLIGASMSLILIGYFSERMETRYDHIAFVSVVFMAILYYFSEFHYKHFKHLRLQEFFRNAGIIAVIILIGAQVLSLWMPRPFDRPKVATATMGESTGDFTPREFERYSFSSYASNVVEVSDSFSYNNIQVLEVKTNYVRYLKGDVYELYEEGIWRKGNEVPIISYDSLLTSTVYDKVDYDAYYMTEETEVILNNIETDQIFINAYGTYENYFPDNLSVLYDPVRKTYRTETMMTRAEKYRFQSVLPKYGTRSLTTLIRAYSNQNIDEAFFVLAGQIPDGMGRVEDLAVDITMGYDNKYDQALAIERYLKENYTYNENPEKRGDRDDPVEHFLFDSKEGFCQQFASSMILMLRSIDIPARYVTGFYINHIQIEDIMDYSNPYFENERLLSGYQLVYDSNAHAWVEAYFPEIGWVHFEPTPGMIYTFSDEDSDFNAFEDRELLIQDEEQEGYVTGETIGVIGITLLVIFIMLLCIIRLIQKKQTFRKKTDKEKVPQYYQIMMRYLTSRQLKRELYETAREHALRVDQSIGLHVRAELMRTIGIYEKSQYSTSGISKDELSEVLNYLKHLRRYIRGYVRFISYLYLRIYEWLAT